MRSCKVCGWVVDQFTTAALAPTLAIGVAGWLASANAAAAAIVLNEIMAANQTTIVNGGDYPDWIELYNTTGATQDLTGMSLSDDPAVPRKFVFPAGTLIAAHFYLIVWCDDATTAPGLHTGFGLAADGQTVTLYSADAMPQALDTVVFGPQLPDFSIGRVPDGTGSWQLCAPTPWLANTAQSLGSASNLRVNEWMAAPSAGADWFELYNSGPLPVALGGLSLTDDPHNPALSPIPALSYIAARGFQLFWADKDPAKGATHANFKLSANGEYIGIYAGATRIDLVSFGPQTTDVSQGRLPDGADNFVSFTSTQSPGDSNYLPLTNAVINEVLAHTDLPLEDAVELFNPTGTAVDLGGWYLSNTKGHPQKYRIPDGATLPANGFLVFYQYQFGANPADPNSFTFNSAHGDEVVLSAAVSGNLTGYRASQKFGATANGISLGRYPTSVGVDFTAMSRRTFGVDNPGAVEDFRTGKGAPNALPLVGPVVINEIMYHPPDIITGTITNDNTLDEFIELYNLTSSSVPLFDPLYPANTWRLTNAVEFVFPQGTTIGPRDCLVIVGFDPQTNAIVLASFRLKYAVPSTVPVLGPWKGKLANGGEAIDLLRPDTPQLSPHPDAGFVPYILVEKIKYADGAPWPEAADGLGSSLQRLNPAAYGNDPANWFAGQPSAGQANSVLQVGSIAVSGNTVQIRFLAPPGRSYSLLGRNTLLTGSWQKLADFPAATTAQPREFSEALGGSGQTCFYQVVSPAAP